MPTTFSGIWYPNGATLLAPIEANFATLASSIETQITDGKTIKRFANTTERNAFYPAASVPTLAYTAGVLQSWDGTYWQNVRNSKTVDPTQAPYFYTRIFGLAANGTGKTAISWPTFPTNLTAVQVSLKWSGGVGTNPVIAMYADPTNSGCNIVFINIGGAVVTTGAYDVAIIAAGF